MYEINNHKITTINGNLNNNKKTTYKDKKGHNAKDYKETLGNNNNNKLWTEKKLKTDSR